MTPEKFRKDRYLRATGYNFYVWAVVNVLITWPLFASLAGDPWPVWLAVLYPLGCILGGIFCAVLNDNRVHKMCGEPDPQPLVEAGGIRVRIFSSVPSSRSYCRCAGRWPTCSRCGCCLSAAPT